MKPVVTWIVFALLPVFIAFFVCVSYNQFLIGIVGLAASFSGLAFALEQKLSRRPATVIVVSGDINARRMGTIRARLSTLFQLFPETIRVRLIKLFPETIRVRLIELFPKRHTIEFVTDGRFIDSALFQLAVKEASKKIYDIDVVIRQFEWRNIPSYISTKIAIGYFNRRSIQFADEELYSSLKVWGDLCIYKGYALIGRKRDFERTPESIAEADQVLDSLLTKREGEGRNAKLISMGADTRWRFESPALKSYSKKRIEFVDVNADEALKRFKYGEADLFIGGLPQRLSLSEDQEFLEIVSSDNLPTLFSVNSLIYNSAIPKSGKLAIRKIFDAWCKLVVEMQGDPKAAHRRYLQWEELTSGFDLSTKTITKTTWEVVFSAKGQKYIEFVVDEKRKVELHTIETLKWCFQYMKKSQLSDSEKIQILQDLSKTYSVHLEWFFQFIKKSQLSDSEVLKILSEVLERYSFDFG
jgi:hypothetical protein